MRKAVKAFVRRVPSSAQTCVFAAAAAMTVYCLALFLLPLFRGTGLDALEHIMSLRKTDLDDIRAIRALSFETDITAAPILRYILTGHADPFFLISIFVSDKAASLLLQTATILKIGGAAFTMCLMLGGTVRLSPKAAALLSVFYGICGPVVSALQNTSLQDLAIFLPLLMFMGEKVTAERRLRTSVIYSILIAAAIVCCGIFCATAVLLFCILTVFLNATGCERSYPHDLPVILRPLLAVIPGLAFAAFAIVPMAVLIPKGLDAGKLFLDGSVSFKFFDFLVYSVNGRAPDTVVAIDPFSLSILTLLLVLLFFFNSEIRLGQKMAFGIVLAFLYITVVYTPFDRLISLWGAGGNFAAARLLCMAVICFRAAGICLKNISGTGRTYWWGAAIAVAAFLIVSNTTKNDMRGDALPLYFSAACLIFWAACASMLLASKNSYRIAVICTVAVIGSLLNLTWTLSKSHIDRVEPYTVASLPEPQQPQSRIDELFDTGDGYGYIVLSSDATDAFATLAMPEGINAMARAALSDNVFEYIHTSEMYTNGFFFQDEGLYRTEAGGGQSELILRASGLSDLSSDYYIYSGFTGRQYLTVMYTEGDEVQSFADSFFFGIDPAQPDFSFRIAVPTPLNETQNVGMWRLDEARYEALKSMIRPLDGSLKVTPDGGAVWDLQGSLTIVTSIPYDTLYVARRDGRNLPVADCMGYLGIVVNNGGASDTSPIYIKVYKEDMVNGAVISLISAGCLFFMYVYDRKSKKNTKTDKAAGAAEEGISAGS